MQFRGMLVNLRSEGERVIVYLLPDFLNCTFSLEQPSPPVRSAGGPVSLPVLRVAGEAGAQPRPLSSGPGGSLSFVAWDIAAVSGVVVSIVFVFCCLHGGNERTPVHLQINGTVYPTGIK